MKKGLLILFVLLSCVLMFTACTNESDIVAPKGDPGVDGTDGTDGKNGKNGQTGDKGSKVEFKNDGSIVYYNVGSSEESQELTSYEEILALVNYSYDIYVVSSKVDTLKEGDVITVDGKSGIVGKNAFSTMANVLIYVNALPKDSKPVIYLDEGEYNEVFNLVHDNITIYGPCANIDDEAYRAKLNEASFTGSVTIKGDNITMNGVTVADLEKTITVTGANFTKICVIKSHN